VLLSLKHQWLAVVAGSGYEDNQILHDNYCPGETTEKKPAYPRLTLHDEVEVAEWAPVPNYF